MKPKKLKAQGVERWCPIQASVVGSVNFLSTKKCAEAPSKIDHPYHYHHPLVLLPESPYGGSCYCDFSYKRCDFFVYHCSCGLDFHIKCALFTLNIAEQKLQELNHIATKDPSVFLEDGNEELENAKCFGCWLPLGESRYFSVACGFNLHIKSAELPHEINHPFHREHPLVLQFNIKRFSCKILNIDYGSYYCLRCNFIAHVKCATKYRDRYYIIEAKDISGNHDDDLGVNPITCVIEQNEGGEMTRIKHFSYAHDLILSDNVMENDITCDGPNIQDTSTLSSIIVISMEGVMVVVKLGEVNLVVSIAILIWILIAQGYRLHKRHEHPPALTYHEGNDYPKHHYCDLCEKERDPNLWFYPCAICEFSAHPNCVLAIYLFIKPGSMYKGKDHPHPLTFVWKPYRYIVCGKCSEPCEALVLECAEPTCNYVVYWKDVRPPSFGFTSPVELYKAEADAITHDC
ncbi:hypothetical protein Golob_016065 [Gossypium lobatum]|uniref:DC1 domain-containing protein n=1 Tax=Gossypium lobatum TaxID=34289 RepID=A0A7J8M2Z6_9ROSI|nr:hypothetical protein [Gossypium lobatum]